MRLNPNVINSIKCNLRKVEESTFAQQDIKELLIDIRDTVSDPRVPIREIGHFLAHPHLRDRGIVHENVSKVYNAMYEGFKGFWGSSEPQRQFQIPISHVFGEEEFADSLINALNDIEEIGFSESTRLAIKTNLSDLMLCVACLLQGAKFKTGNEFATAFLGVSQGGTIGVFVIAPVIEEARCKGIVWEVIKTKTQADADIKQANMPGQFKFLKQMERKGEQLAMTDTEIQQGDSAGAP